MRAWVGAAVVAVALAPAAAAADCAAPSILVDAETVAPGDTIHVTGDYFAEGCNDNGGGCAVTSQGPPPPLTGVQLELRRGMTDIDAAAVDVDETHGFAGDLTVPDDAKPGSYFVIAVHEQTTELDRVKVTVKRPR